MYTDNALLFPHHAIRTLRQSRGAAWRKLVDRVASLPETHEETLAFMLMMIRLNGCTGCETDSYRAMRGCSACALQTLRRYKGSDEEILLAYHQALADIREFAASNPPLGIQHTERVLEIL